MYILAIIPLILLVICAFKESSITGLYKANKVYGRFTAYLALDLTLVGVVAVLSLFVPALSETGFHPAMGLLSLVGILLYVLAFLKCPEPLKAKCIPCMILSGLGVTMKICVFFLPFVWKLTAPEAAAAGGIPEVIQDRSGNSCRTRVDGDFIYISRPDGTEECVRRDYIDASTRLLDTGGNRYHW